ncbi:uncharacterized protein RHIMIDRAFT_240984 [Rhizopus microsporus ATCC 52813]|uniref:Hamartin-domain-containing protein n=1 Tax=Rhizopus microsporus ATCC 52813 TaxID=1340429 RepID=A0A2G4SL44_RHIZD|nr:uncharacterized protein RHIMIDRAFT_240984 [Rhizopus microsporus ATCC 52813]PHZ09106.1 hypothetical protein RHIMIDRAFT_240984 [Rhizopus microsporus ATCC 52813]
MVTFKEITKSIAQAVRNSAIDPEGQSACDVIEQYLDEQTVANGGSLPTIDTATIDKLSQDLISLYCSTVDINHAPPISSKPEALRSQAQHYILLRCIHALLPLLRPQRIFEEWWPLLQPVLTHASYTNKIKKEARLFIADSLIAELETEDECTYFHMLINIYLDTNQQQQQQETQKDETTRLHQTLLDLEQSEWSKNLTTILLTVGASETKQFFLLLNGYFLSSKHRLQIVYLMSEFMRRRRTHLHEILDTPLFDSMLKSLMYDNSTTLIATSVTNLIMLLPRICTSLPPFLPQLFYIFARAICWDQLRDLRKKQSIDSTYHSPTYIADGWDCVDYTFSKLSAPPSNPQTGAFFTSLYGLYPCNFLKFLYKPYAYFKEKQFIFPEEFDEETFKARTITQVTRHMLHPNLVLMDTESELTDKTRWMKMEPPDVMAQIMGLDLTNAASRVAFGHENNHSHRQQDLLDESLWEDTQRGSVKEDESTKEISMKQDEEKEQTDPESTQEDSKQAPAMVSSIMKLHKALKSGAEVLVGDDVWDSFGIKQQESIESLDRDQASAEDETMSSETKLLLAGLKREVLLLKNELNFELFLKQQHLQHIGRLHREHVLDSSVEAERQQLYNTTRMLKAQLNQTTSALEKLRAESALTKQKHVKWEDEQSGKLRGYREARKEWQNQMTRVEYQLEEYKKQLKEQKVQLDSAKQQIFELENELKTLEPVINKVTESEHRVKQLTQQMLLWEEDTSHMEEQKRYIKGLLSQWWSMEELVASLQSENKRLQEEQVQKEEQLEKLAIQLAELHTKADEPVHSNMENVSVEKKALEQTLKEAKLRLEQLEHRWSRSSVN